MTISEQGATLVATLAHHRVGAQLTLVRHLTVGQRTKVMRGMILLTEAARRSAGDGGDKHDATRRGPI